MSIGFVENAGLGPCELQDPVWAKMSALAAGVNKKRKKSETKPQAQINKCNNEKRRREQENIYIEELAELISANFADMSSLSVKPDKSAILQETVNQIRSIRQRELATQSQDPVQQGEVSSSRPTILSNEVYGPLLLEALEGFLFVINSEGRVEYVTENVIKYTKYSREEIHGKSIYNIIHPGDHARFSHILMPMSVGCWGSNSEEDSTTTTTTTTTTTITPTQQTTTTTTTVTKGNFSVRFLIKLPETPSGIPQPKEPDVQLMYISSTQLKDQVALNPEDDNNSDSGPYVLCVASRVNTRDKGLNGVEQFTTKLDISGNVTCVDTSGVSEKYGKFINKDFMDRPLRDLVQQDEVHKLTAHLRDALTAGQATSGIYKLQIGEDKFVEVQTKSKLFKSNPNTNDPNEVDFIMATHTIICADPDKESGDDPGGGGGGGIGSITNNLNDTITTNNDNNNNNSGGVVGGPLMTSVVNGTTTNNRNSGGGTNVSSVSSDSSTASSTNNTLLNSVVNANAVTSFTTLTIDSDYAFEFLPSSSTGMGWDFEPTSWIDTTTSTPPTSATATTSTTIGTIQQRPESRQSNTTTTPVSTPTPRPPSNPSYSPCGTTNIAQSPFSGGSSNNSATQASPSTPSGSTTTTTNNPYTFPFSPLTEQNYPTNLVGSATSNDNNDKDTKANLLDDPSTNMMVDSGKLRDLLTKPPADSSGSSSTGANSNNNNNNNNNNNDPDGRNKNRILKSLLKQQDEDDNRTSPRGGSSVSLIRNSGNTTTGGELPKTSTSGGNNMLLQLLNEKSDDDDLEAKAGVKKKNELFHQLIKTAENRNSDDDKKNDMQTSHDDSLLRSLGFTSSPSPPGDEPGKARKRPSDDRDDNPNKRTADGSQVSSSGGSSKLCERNKMLASLLAKQPNNHQPIPPVPASVISATPHEKLPRVTLDPNINKTMPNRLINQNMSHQSIGNNRVNNTRLGGVRQQQQQQQQPQQNTSYLTSILTPNNLQQHQQQQQRTTDNRQQMVNSTCFNTATTTSPATSSTTNDNLTWNSINDNNNMHMNDPFLSELLDQVIDIVPEDMMHILDGNDGQQQNNFQGGLSEKMAINIIQKSLMQCETAVKSPSSPTISLPGTPPAYSSATMTTQNNNNNNQIRPFPPPPNYHQANFIQKQRMPIRTGLIGAVGTVAGAAVTASQYAVAAAAAGNNLVNAQLLLQQRKQTILQQQQEQKRRLLQQQQQQELLIPSNATAAEINSSLQNLDYNTVAPNVTLTRSTSLSESQLSPGYGNGNGSNNSGQQSQQQTQQQQQPPPPPPPQQQQQQQTPNQRISQQQPYSPHSQLVSPLSNQQPNFQQTSNYQQARLSPQTAFNQQLSPRQTYPQGGVTGGQSQNWQQTQARLSLQNPMLNAQLTGNYITGGPNGRNFQRTPASQQQQQQPPPPQQQPTSQPQQRSINSPGAVTTRHSPYPADSFPPPTSPNSNVFNQNQYLRLQRANSVPTATTQLPGGLGSPRPYGREHHPHPPYHPPPPPPQSQIPNQHHPHQQHPMMYQPQPPPQDTSQYCYDQAGIQLATAYNGADRGGRIPPPPHLQAGVTGSGPTSEFVRQELRAVVGARTGQQSQTAPPNSQQPAPPPPPPQQQPNRPPSSQLINQQQVDLEALGLTFEMPTSGASDSPKLWGAMGTDMGSMSPPQPATSRTTMEDGRAGDHTNKSSLLQKLLSE